jgi:colicin import membrane protein
VEQKNSDYAEEVEDILSDAEEDGEFEIKHDDLGEASSGNEEMDSVTESIVVQLQEEQPKSKKQAASKKSTMKRPVVKQESSEEEDVESEHPIIEFTAVSP